MIEDTTVQASVEAFRAQLRGALIEPGDPSYDAARRVYNAMIDKRPRFIAQCADVADVISMPFVIGRLTTVPLIGASTVASSIF